MKHYNILSLILLLYSTSIFAQHTNELDTETYQTIKFNGFLKSKIEASNADVAVLKTFFGNEVSITGDDDGGIEDGWKTFEFKRIIISFDDTNPRAKMAFISYINAQSFTLKDKTINIGDTISILGSDISLKLDKKGGKFVSFTYLNGDCCPIVISLDANEKVLKIEYFVWT